MSVNPSPPDIKAHLDAADSVVDALPWKLGDSEAQRKLSRGKVSALAHQVAGLLAAGWTQQELRAVLAAATQAADAPDAPAQEKRWRSALKQARVQRRTPGAQEAGGSAAG
jgi:hypothetical protein